MRIISAVNWLVGIVLLSGCATVSRPGDMPLTATIPLNTLCQQYSMECRWDGVSQSVTMRYQGSTARIIVGTSAVMVDGKRVVLSSPVRRSRGVVMVPKELEGLLIKPQEAGKAEARSAYRVGKVVIDAGHGGKDPGAISSGGVREKDIALDIAKRLKTNLTKVGIETIMTRSDDTFLTLGERTEAASRPDVDLFVSLHANAHKSSRAQGIEVYYASVLRGKDLQESQRLNNQRKLCRSMSMEQNSSDVRRIVLSMLYDQKYAQSAGIATSLARGVSRDMSAKLRGAKESRFYVLRNTLVPAILIETGFVSNPLERKKLQSVSYRQKLADAIARQVLEYLYAKRI